MALDATTILTTVIAVEYAADARVDNAIALAAQRMGTDATDWGDSYQHALAHLAAHTLAKADRSKLGTGGVSAPGAVTSIKTGALAVGFAPIAAAHSGPDRDLATTAHGVAFMAIRDENEPMLPEWVI